MKTPNCKGSSRDSCETEVTCLGGACLGEASSVNEKDTGRCARPSWEERAPVGVDLCRWAWLLKDQDVELVDHPRRIDNVVGLALAGGRAHALEGPGEAHRLSIVLGNGGVVPFHEARDGRVTRGGEATDQAGVRLSGRLGCRAGLGDPGPGAVRR